MAEKIIIYGLSSVGLRVAEFLKQTGTEPLVATYPASPYLSKIKNCCTNVIEADLSNFELLRKIEISDASAIILPSSDEQFNLQAALHAVEINPKISVVLRLFNTKLAAKLEENMQNFKVISASQVASAAFATAALLEKPILSLKESDKIFSFFRVPCSLFAQKTVNETEKEHSLDIVAINKMVFPAKNEKIPDKGSLCIFSEFKNGFRFEKQPCPEKNNTPTKAIKKETIPLSKRLLGMDKILRNTLTALISVIIFCIAYFYSFENLSFINAVYFVVTVLTSTGFGDISLKDSSTLSKIIGIMLMLSGISLFTILFAMITDTLIKKRMDLMLGRKRSRLSGHIVLCGTGDVGIRILEDLLALGEKVVVVEKNPENKFFAAVKEMNIPFIISDATQEKTLSDANIPGAKAIICAMDNDIINLEVGLNARALNRNIRVVLRIFDKDFASRIEKCFDIHYALSSSHIAAPAFASAAQGTGVVNTLDIEGELLFLVQEKLDGIKDELKTLFALNADNKVFYLRKG
ncbi:MAG: NAD-binding protein [Nitrospirae bacterium]|nr:NAD-binding protein [Nitrospirota bacterium]